MDAHTSSDWPRLRKLWLGRVCLVFASENLRLVELDMHMISDEELELLKEGNKDGSIYWALAAGGAGIGFGQNLINAAYSVYSDLTPQVSEFALGLCATILLSSSIVCYFTSRHVGASVTSLVEAVKKRPKHNSAEECNRTDGSSGA